MTAFTLSPLADEDIAPLVSSLCGTPCPSDATCETRHAALREPLLDSVDNVVVARAGGVLAGYARVVVSSDHGSLFVECAGEVFEPWRGQGIGHALLEWSRDRSLALAGGRPVELLVDVLDGQDDLVKLLARQGFGLASGFVELSRPLRPPIEDASPAEVRPLDLVRDRDAIKALYSTVFQADPHSGRGRARIEAALAHPGLRPDQSRVAGSPDGLLALALVVTWPDDPADLWVETVCVRPSARGTDVVRRMLADITRSAPGTFRSMSIGLPRGEDGDTALAGYTDLGFSPVRGWSRYSLLLA